MRTIRASEIGLYVYCRQAWWYQKQGIEPENQAELAGGSEIHRQHGQQVLASGCTRVLAYIILFAALAALTVYVIDQFLSTAPAGILQSFLC